VADARNAQKVGSLTAQVIKTTGSAANVTAGAGGSWRRRSSSKNWHRRRGDSVEREHALTSRTSAMNVRKGNQVFSVPGPGRHGYGNGARPGSNNGFQPQCPEHPRQGQSRALSKPEWPSLIQTEEQTRHDVTAGTRSALKDHPRRKSPMIRWCGIGSAPPATKWALLGANFKENGRGRPWLPSPRQDAVGLTQVGHLSTHTSRHGRESPAVIGVGLVRLGCRYGRRVVFYGRSSGDRSPGSSSFLVAFVASSL